MVTLTEESLALQVGGWARGQPPSPGKKQLAKQSQPKKVGRTNGRGPKRAKRNKVPNWKTLTQDRRGWKEKLVEKAKTL